MRTRALQTNPETFVLRAAASHKISSSTVLESSMSTTLRFDQACRSANNVPKDGANEHSRAKKNDAINAPKGYA